ncbi:MAG: hypothetical protein GX845_00775 [Erysipelothrix sp.]|nr:hypothetical protein [Erysipelothrix sp.]
MMAKKKPVVRDSQEKTELAKQIASRSKRVVRTYANIETSIMRVIRWLSGVVDKFLFNNQYGKIVALVLALMLYMTINFGGEGIFDGGVSGAGDTINNIPLRVIANDEVYEVSGLPQTVSALIVGDLADIQMTKNQGEYQVVADLTGLTEGTHQVNLLPQNFSPRVNVAINPATAIVKVERKISSRFVLDYDFVNVNKMDLEYVLGEPQLELNEVIIRAAEDTIKEIAFVKAFIDVEGVTESFNKEVPIVAYDQQGQRVNVDVIPATIKADVEVTSPNKTVPVVVDPVGEIPDGKAIDAIVMDHQSVTLYGPDAILSQIEQLRVPINATTLTGDTNMVYTISLPSGVRKSSVTRVNLEITLTEGSSVTFTDVPINYRHNNADYRFTLLNPDDAYTDVEVFGSVDRIGALNVDDIQIYIDMFDIGLGEQVVPLYSEGPTSLIQVKPKKKEIEINVIR